MNCNAKKLGFITLIQKTTTVIIASLGLLSNNSAQSFHQETDRSLSNLNYESLKNRNSKSKLILKLNPNNPERMLIAQHSSHSSHASHSSHSSHFSSSTGYSDKSSTGGDNTNALPLIVAGAVIATGGYLIGKNKGKRK
ncbi:MAG: hypothetical protein ACTHOB_10435 [Ginsengibacter sp.]